VVVSAAAKQAIDRYGTSVSASRQVSGERPLHCELENAIARVYDVEDAVVLASGHTSNLSSIGCLFGADDFIVYDESVHPGTVHAIAHGSAHHGSFAHNDWSALDALLTERRREFQRVLVIIEGLYSRDGDIPDLPRFIELKERHRVFLLVDESHSFGVLGAGGRGIREHFGRRGDEVDIWLGSLGKALAGAGGYVAGSHALIEQLNFLAPDLKYSIGLAPPLAAAPIAALEHLERDPGRAVTLKARGALFLQLARDAGIDTGTSAGIGMIPALIGHSARAARVSAGLFARGIHVRPTLYPEVPEERARLRFFMCCEHSPADIHRTVAALAGELALVTS
jgi:7-keto-8-aminopelargonate synthetase-like enzyme